MLRGSNLQILLLGEPKPTSMERLGTPFILFSHREASHKPGAACMERDSRARGDALRTGSTRHRVATPRAPWAPWARSPLGEAGKLQAAAGEADPLGSGAPGRPHPRVRLPDPRAPTRARGPQNKATRPS